MRVLKDNPRFQGGRYKLRKVDDTFYVVGWDVITRDVEVDAFDDKGNFLGQLSKGKKQQKRYYGVMDYDGDRFECDFNISINFKKYKIRCLYLFERLVRVRRGPCLIRQLTEAVLNEFFPDYKYGLGASERIVPPHLKLWEKVVHYPNNSIIGHPNLKKIGLEEILEFRNKKEKEEKDSDAVWLIDRFFERKSNICYEKVIPLMNKKIKELAQYKQTNKSYVL